MTRPVVVVCTSAVWQVARISSQNGAQNSTGVRLSDIVIIGHKHNLSQSWAPQKFFQKGQNYKHLKSTIFRLSEEKSNIFRCAEGPKENICAVLDLGYYCERNCWGISLESSLWRHLIQIPAEQVLQPPCPACSGPCLQSNRESFSSRSVLLHVGLLLGLFVWSP